MLSASQLVRKPSGDQSSTADLVPKSSSSPITSTISSSVRITVRCSACRGQTGHDPGKSKGQSPPWPRFQAEDQGCGSLTSDGGGGGVSWLAGLADRRIDILICSSVAEVVAGAIVLS